ncbi:hypothetical protein DFH28DRAFT_826658, partial [Melampsora americana]
VTVQDVLKNLSNQVEQGRINLINLSNEQKVKVGCFVAIEDPNEQVKIGYVSQILGDCKRQQHQCYTELTVCNLTTQLIPIHGMRGLVKTSRKVWVKG